TLIENSQEFKSEDKSTVSVSFIIGNHIIKPQESEFPKAKVIYPCGKLGIRFFVFSRKKMSTKDQVKIKLIDPRDLSKNPTFKVVFQMTFYIILICAEGIIGQI